jgi:hypothetical protein
MNAAVFGYGARQRDHARDNSPQGGFKRGGGPPMVWPRRQFPSRLSRGGIDQG